MAGTDEHGHDDGGESLFSEVDGRLLPSRHTRGPWDPRALHGGAAAALIADALERHDPQRDTAIARLSYEFLRPIPFAPLSLRVRTVRAGRRVQELAAELRAAEKDAEPSEPAAVIVRASALRVTRVPQGVPPEAIDAGSAEPMAPLREASPVRFTLNDSEQDSFASSAMEMRATVDPRRLGRGRVWMRLARALLPGRRAGPLARLAATADFGNGIGAALRFDEWAFINADLAIHLQRPPRGEWVGMDARTLLDDGGIAMAESVLHDAEGQLARAFQTLVVQRR